jgi:hypothetical protein
MKKEIGNSCSTLLLSFGNAFMAVDKTWPHASSPDSSYGVESLERLLIIIFTA